MTKEIFDFHLNALFDKIEECLSKKAGGYANTHITSDRLYNFKEIGILTNQSPQQVLLVLMMKHFVVIRDWIVKKQEYSYSEFEERVIDCIDYLILYKMLEEEKYEREGEEDA